MPIPTTPSEYVWFLLSGGAIIGTLLTIFNNWLVKRREDKNEVLKHRI